MEVLKIFIALLVLVNPLGAIPIFIGLTPNASLDERNKIALTASKAVAIVMVLFVLIGDGMLKFL